MTAAVIVGCKAGEVSVNKSILGLEAGQDARIRNSNSPIYIALSDWFQKFKASARGAKSVGFNSTAADLRTTLPSVYVTEIDAYLQQQTVRTTDLRRAIAANDRATIAKLLDLETREMMDIALVIINPKYQPRTDDRLARFMAAARRNSQILDRFAASGFLDALLEIPGMSIAKLVNDAERQRGIYLAALKSLYLDDATNLDALSRQLDQTTASIVALRSALASGHSSSLVDGSEGGLGLTGNPSGAPLAGPAAVFMSFANMGTIDAQKKLATQAKYAAAPVTAGAAGDSVFDPNALPSTAGNGSAAATGSGSGADNPTTSADNGINYDKKEAPPGDDLLADIPVVAAASGSVTPPAPTQKSASASAPVSSGSSSSQNSDPLAALLAKFINPGDMSQGAALTDAPAVAPAEPILNADNFHLKGYALVQFHRYAGYSNLKLHPTPVKSRGLGLTTGGAGLPKADADILRHKVLAGSAESGDGHIFNQGSVGSCSLQAATGAGYVGLSALGVDPKTLLPKDGEAINEAFNSIQNGEATLEGAIQTIKTILEKKGYTVTEKQVNGFDEAAAAMAAGTPVLLGLPVDMATWTGSGGGAELGAGLRADDAQDFENSITRTGFGLAGAGAEASLLCDQGGANGHAILGVGYDAETQPLIKNSWGGDWNGHGGIGKVSRSSCDSQFSGYSIEVTKN